MDDLGSIKTTVSSRKSVTDSIKTEVETCLNTVPALSLKTVRMEDRTPVDKMVTERDVMAGTVPTCEERTEDAPPTAGQSMMTVEHSLQGSGKQVYERLENTGKDLKTTQRMQVITRIDIPDSDGDYSTISEVHSMKEKHGHVIRAADASLEKLPLLKKVKLNQTELPGTAHPSYRACMRELS